MDYNYSFFGNYFISFEMYLHLDPLLPDDLCSDDLSWFVEEGSPWLFVSKLGESVLLLEVPAEETCTCCLLLVNAEEFELDPLLPVNKQTKQDTLFWIQKIYKPSSQKKNTNNKKDRYKLSTFFKNNQHKTFTDRSN